VIFVGDMPAIEKSFNFGTIAVSFPYKYENVPIKDNITNWRFEKSRFSNSARINASFARISGLRNLSDTSAKIV
jgi:hypothetical protein